MKTRLTKIEVATTQLRAAIRLFFCEEPPIVVETLVSAASGVLRGLAAHHGLKSILHDNPAVKPEHMKKWVALLHESANFFKHADRDPTGTFDYEPQMLHYLLLEACQVHRELMTHLALQYSKESVAYQLWFSFKYPHLLRDPVAFRTLIQGKKLDRFNPDDFQIMRMMIGIEPIN
jgi:hypothetical protein